MGPIVHSLWSLEASTANAADVYIFWLAICASLRELFDADPDQSGISHELASKVRAIVNKRVKSFINNSLSDIYFTAFFLDPRECLVMQAYHPCEL